MATDSMRLIDRALTFPVAYSPAYNPGGRQNYLPKLDAWKAAAAAVNGGSADARILCVGNSTTIGLNAAGNANWPCEYDYVASTLDAKVNTHKDAFFGFSTASGNRITKDTRITNTGGAIGSASTLGGFSCQLATLGNNIVFTPTETVDTFRVFWWYNGALDISIQATGGTAFTATLSSGTGTQFGTSNLRYVDVVAGSLAPGNAVTITKTGGAGTLQIIGIEARNSTTKQVIVINAGHWGSKSADWATAGGSLRSPLDVIGLAPTGYFTIVNIKAGINDANTAVAIDTYKTNIQAIITAAKAKGSEVILESDNPISTGLTPPYISALNDLAIANNLFFVNSHDSVFIDYATANANLYMADTLHPNTAGFSAQATPLSNLLIQRGGL